MYDHGYGTHSLIDDEGIRMLNYVERIKYLGISL